MLDGLLRLVERDWQRFRGRPNTASLDRLGRSIEALHDHLRASCLLVEAGSAGLASEDVAPAGSRRPAEPSGSTTLRPPIEPEPLPSRRPPELSGVPENESPRYPPFRDQDTGLHSREGFDAVASGELKRCRRYERTFSLLLLQLPERDPDGLRRAAGVVRRSLRESDLAGRHVDRTLAVALPETTLDNARRVARRLVSGLERVGGWTEEARLGIAGHPFDGETLLALFDTARGQLSLSGNAILYPSSREPSERG